METNRTAWPLWVVASCFVRGCLNITATVALVCLVNWYIFDGQTWGTWQRALHPIAVKVYFTLMIVNFLILAVQTYPSNYKVFCAYRQAKENTATLDSS